ncbi:MAG: hypothetical protein SCARUB_03308, partial [Candidatus Scalindua rubra]
TFYEIEIMTSVLFEPSWKLPLFVDLVSFKRSIPQW